MLEMMGQMMGKKPGEDQDSKSNQGGEGSTGESDSAQQVLLMNYLWFFL